MVEQADTPEAGQRIQIGSGDFYESGYHMASGSSFADDTHLPAPAFCGRYSGEWVAEDPPREFVDFGG
jgi:hypothetical protein